MEAATPLRQPHVRVLGDVVAIDGLVVDDECAVRVVREREQNGDDPAKTVRDAVEIGARVLDREQAGANAEFVKTEFEKAATDLNSQFTTRAREVAEYFNERVEQVFGPENGHLSRELEKLFSDGSTASVQNRVRELVQEAMARSREDLMKQFSSADGSNPLADFKAGTIRVLQGGRGAPARDAAADAAPDGRAREAASGAPAREGEARGGRGRARARNREGAQLRGGGRRRRRRDRTRAGRRGRGRWRREGGHRQGRRRGGGHRRLQRPRPRAHRDRGQGQAAVEARCAEGARSCHLRAERGLRRPGRPDRGRAPGQARAAPGVQRRQDGRRARSRVRGAAARVRVPDCACPCTHEALGRRRNRRGRRACNGRARARCPQRRAQDQDPAHGDQDRAPTRPRVSSTRCPLESGRCWARSMPWCGLRARSMPSPPSTRWSFRAAAGRCWSSCAPCRSPAPQAGSPCGPPSRSRRAPRSCPARASSGSWWCHPAERVPAVP